MMILLAVVALPLAVLFLLVVSTMLYRRVIRRTVQHPQLGALTTYGREIHAELVVDGKTVDVQLRSLDPAHVNAALALPGAYQRLRRQLGEAAIAEWLALGDAFADEPGLGERLTPLLGDPEAFLATFTFVGAEVAATDATLSFELLSPWDPEHPYRARLDRHHALAAFGLACAMG